MAQVHPSTAAASQLAPSYPVCHSNLYSCTQPCLDGYNYCTDHITDDRNAPYRGCTFVFSNGRKCVNAVLKGERRDGLCQDHAKRSALCKMKSLRKRQPAESLETLLDELQQRGVELPPPTGPAGADAKQQQPQQHQQQQPKLLDYASESDSDSYVPNCQQTHWRRDDSDAESVDSDQDDPLRHAGVYTQEEVVLLTRDKLHKLQSLYVEQFKRLHQQLKEARRRYVHAVKKEKEAPYPDTASERRAVAKLRALGRYQRHRGVDALLHHQLQEKRLQVTQGVNYRAPPTPKCSFQDGGVKCAQPALPLTKHCARHVLHDGAQLLFRPCGAPTLGGQDQCREPVVDLAPETRCIYHTRMPPPTVGSCGAPMPPPTPPPPPPAAALAPALPAEEASPLISVDGEEEPPVRPS